MLLFSRFEEVTALVIEAVVVRFLNRLILFQMFDTTWPLLTVNNIGTFEK